MTYIELIRMWQWTSLACLLVWFLCTVCKNWLQMVRLLVSLHICLSMHVLLVLNCYGIFSSFLYLFLSIKFGIEAASRSCLLQNSL